MAELRYEVSAEKVRELWERVRWFERSGDRANRRGEYDLRDRCDFKAYEMRGVLEELGLAER